jgi:hypothetical protein
VLPPHASLSCQLMSSMEMDVIEHRVWARTASRTRGFDGQASLAPLSCYRIEAGLCHGDPGLDAARPAVSAGS